MFSITIEAAFKASHRLTLPGGSKEPAHSHNWLVEVTVSRRRLDETGCVMDFHKLKAAAESVLADLDNDGLETVEYFVKNNPSAENVAKYVFEKLIPILPQKTEITSVEVTEEPTCRAKFATEAGK